MQKTKAKALMSLIALTAWFALALQLYILVDNTAISGLTTLEAVGRFFIFFTILSNILVAVCLTTILSAPGSRPARFFLKPTVITAVALYIFVVGLIYNILLRSLWHPEGSQKLVDELLHVAVPLSFTLYWLLYAPKKSLQWVHASRWLIFPAIYLVYAMLRGGLEGFYPYPFLDANTLPFGRIVMNCIGLMFVFVLFGLLFIAAGRKLSR
ncbi:MAG: Pr6Pr family membrane protein [Bacteroidota bacterium]|nr:Pr6Pr family membrane protein [Bacteroidota bacterium]